MPHFLPGMEFNLETMLLAATISFVISVILIWGIVVPANRSRLNQLRTTLEKDILSSEQQRMQLGSELNNLQQKIQKTELKVTEQTAQITELEKEKQAVQTEAGRASALELSLHQKNLEFAQLTGRLQESEKKLENLQQSLKNSLGEKDAAINALTTSLNQQQSQAAQAEQNLQQLQTEFSQLQQTKLEQQQQLENSLQQLQSKFAQAQQSQLEQQQQAERSLQQLQVELAQVQQSKLEQQQQLEGTTLQVERLEQRLADRSAKSTAVKSPETLEQQQTIQRLQASNQALERKLQESQLAINELSAKNNKKPATVESELAHKITELNIALTEQGNYIFRLEYDLEVKKALINDQNSPLKTIPAAIIAKQEQAEVRIMELEQRLNPNRKVVKKTVEKTQPKQSELLNPAKQQIDEITDKAKHLPDQFKGFYQKILAKKTQETPPSKSSEASNSKKSEPEKQLKTEKVSTKSTAASGGLKGFFKKLDSQAEVVAAEKSSDSKKSQPEKPTTAEAVSSKHSVSSEGGLKGFFKKLDKQAEVIEPAKSSENSKKSSLEKKQTQAEEIVTNSGWMGIFKK